MQILVDENIPYAAQMLHPFGQVTSFPGRELKPNQLKDIDTLLIRSITQVNASLLEHANCLKYVGTATIGTDHVDQFLLAKKEILFSSAPGCNAKSVADYILSALCHIEESEGWQLRDKTIGIVGIGNIGRQVASMLKALNVRCLLCDPLVEPDPVLGEWVDYATLLSQSDCVTFHVPLTKEGKFTTYQMLSDEQLAIMKPNAVIMNASRGDVIDNQALLRAKQGGRKMPLVLDVWQGEPKILEELIPFTQIATAHIAGYSLEGKAKGTYQLAQWLSQHEKITLEQPFSSFLPASPFEEIHIGHPMTWETVRKFVHLVYDVRRDDVMFRRLFNEKGFDWLRKHYPERRELSVLPINIADQDSKHVLSALGFTVL
ncbi:4-phosphoerythronate dehydrogenase [Algicola sagamiensis]|uniref:4-phosphoerythronate dehydrogenase n=1 Tax=Algicola sagamiensis TaxID=163869 RepID=UPI00036117F7|nr:4-phosphoerythronate dehydrogenase [Algicola sagamiensis]